LYTFNRDCFGWDMLRVLAKDLGHSRHAGGGVFGWFAFA